MNEQSRFFEVVYQAPGSGAVGAISTKVFQQPNFDDDKVQLRRRLADMPSQELKDVSAVVSFFSWRRGERVHAKPTEILRGAVLYFRFKLSQSFGTV